MAAVHVNFEVSFPLFCIVTCKQIYRSETKCYFSYMIYTTVCEAQKIFFCWELLLRNFSL